MSGKLRVPVIATPTSGPLGTQFTLKWAVAGAPVGLKFDVDRKVPGALNWTAWKRGVIGTSGVTAPGPTRDVPVPGPRASTLERRNQ